MMQATHKSMRTQLKKLTAIANGRELTAALKELHAYFTEWQAKKIDSFELNDRIHKYHQETAREIWKMYNITKPGGMMVARALALGFLSEEEIGPDLVEKLGPLIDFWNESHIRK